MHTHVFGLNIQEKKMFHFNFEFNHLLIYIQILVFCIIKEFQHLFLNMLWYKKFYVTHNYKAQEQIQGIWGTTHV